MKIIIVNKKQLAKQFTLVPQATKVKIFDAIEALQNFPNIHFDIKKLQNYSAADYRIRIGNYRLLFNIDIEAKEVQITSLLHRKDAYRR